jgi:hypothetical protein
MGGECRRARGGGTLVMESLLFSQQFLGMRLWRWDKEDWRFIRTPEGGFGGLGEE